MARGFRNFRRRPSRVKSKTAVTYQVDTGTSYIETVPQGQSVLSPSSFTPTKSGWTFTGWRENNTASSEVLSEKKASGKTMVLYAVFQQNVTVTYRDYTQTKSASNPQYYNNGNSLPATFQLAQTAISGWTARGWTTATSGGASTISYSNNVAFTRTANVTLYGCYYRTVTISYNGNGNTGGSTAASTGTAYYHSSSGGTNASITVRACGFSKTNYSFYRWRLNSASSSTLYAANSTYSSTADCTMYAYWVQATSATYNYTGGMQSFTALAGVTYKIQMYGAQGGSESSTGQVGGAGGYTIGYRKPTNNETWYIGVGGAASTFNGGGSGRQTDGGFGKNGGGASHVGLSNAQLSGTPVGNLIGCAGGGGGVGAYFDSSILSNGGAGGGTSGGGSSIWYNSSASGGGQSGGGQWGGGYGQGGSAYAGNAGGGGGGGYYGGGGGDVNAGGGGSGNTRGMTSASMSNGQKSGNGQVIITVYSVS